jgi:hypothetical protein
MSTRCTELIITEDTLRGTDGELLAERDPSIGSLLRVFAEEFTGARKENFLRIIKELS